MIAALLGYAPDADPHIAGVITDASGIVPTLKGMAGAPSPSSVNMATLAATCVGAALLTKLDDTTRLLAGTTTKIYEAGVSTWSDVSRAATYTTGTTGVWRFAQQGNVSLAANGADTVQASVSTGAFSCISGGPVAAIVETVGKFVFAANTSTSAQGVRWSAINDYTNWTASIASQSGSDTLTTTSGPITAARRFGNLIVIYKKSSMYLGTYVGPPNIWQFDLIPGTAGAMSQEAVVNIGTPENPKHIFMGEDDFYIYDGSKPVRIGSNRVSKTVYASLRQNRYYACKALHDKKNRRVYFYYPVQDSAQPSNCVVYNYATDRWGIDNRSIEATVDYVSGSITYDGLGALYATYDDFPNLAYDIAFVGNTQSTPAIFNTSHVIQTLNGPAGSAYIISGDYGDDLQFSTLRRVRPRFITAPVTATMTNFYRNSPGDSLTTDTLVSLSNGGFDVMRDARWHRLQMNFSGDWEMNAIAPDFVISGLE